MYFMTFHPPYNYILVHFVRTLLPPRQILVLLLLLLLVIGIHNADDDEAQKNSLTYLIFVTSINSGASVNVLTEGNFSQ